MWTACGHSASCRSALLFHSGVPPAHALLPAGAGRTAEVAGDRHRRRSLSYGCLMRTVELLLDTALDETVRAVWQRLHAAGRPSLATHTHATNRPHLTLAAADRLPPQVVLALASLPIDIELGPVVYFARAVVWRVNPSAALRELHLSVWHALEGTERSPLHAPHSWIPHVSLALRGKNPAAYATELRGLAVARGRCVEARTYDTASRTVTALTPGRPPGRPPVPAP